MYGDQFGEFVCGYWGLKSLQGLTVQYLETQCGFIRVMLLHVKVNVKQCLKCQDLMWYMYSI